MKKAGLIVLILIISLLATLIIVRNPLARSLNNKGIEQYKQNKYELAEKYFARAVRWNKGYTDALINLVKTQLSMDKRVKAAENIAVLAAKTPSLAETSGLQGQLLVMEQKYEEAIDKLTQAIETDSLLAYAYFYRAIAYGNLNNLEASAKDYLRAKDLDRSNAAMLAEGAVIFGKLENFEAAIKNYDLILELDPSNTDAFLKRGTFKMQIKDHTGSIADFNNALNLEPKLAEAYFNRGTSYANLQEFKKAIADFDKSASLKYKPAKSYYNAGLANQRLQRYDEAFSYLQKAIKNDVDLEYSSNAYNMLGVIEMTRNRSQKAIGYFDESIKLNPNSADALFNRAIAYGMMKLYDNAIRDLNKCVDLGKKTSEVYYARGVQYISLNKFTEGCADISEAVAMGNQDAVAIQQQFCK
jgi:tetratricopeptide (TPR) repeat protein